MQVKWDGAIREARRKSKPVERRVEKLITSQRAPDFGHTHKREKGWLGHLGHAHTSVAVLFTARSEVHITL